VREMPWWADKKSPSKAVTLFGKPWRIIKGPVAGSTYGRRSVQHDEYAACMAEDWGEEELVVQFEIVNGRVKVEYSNTDAMAQKLGVRYDPYDGNVDVASWRSTFGRLERELQKLFDARRKNGRARRSRRSTTRARGR
jgi:hypothetical protein